MDGSILLGMALACYLIAFLNLRDAIQDGNIQVIFNWLGAFVIAPIAIPVAVFWRISTIS